MDRGYLKIYRTLLDWEWRDNPIMVYFWVRILLLANWKDISYQGQIVERGSFLTSYRGLANELHLSVRQIRTCLEKLVACQQVVIKSTHFPTQYATKVTICNYSLYQDNPHSEQQSKEQSNDTVATQFLISTNLNSTTSEERKKEKKPLYKDKSLSKVKESFSLPYSSPRFVELWSILIEQPKWKKKSPHALQLNLADLAKYPESFANLLMEDSIKNGWQGIVFSNTPEKYQAWLKEHPKTETPSPQAEGKQWKQPHYLYSYEEFMANAPSEFEQLLPLMQEDLKAGKKMLCRDGVWEWPEDYPNYEIYE